MVQSLLARRSMLVRSNVEGEVGAAGFMYVVCDFPVARFHSAGDCAFCLYVCLLKAANLSAFDVEGPTSPSNIHASGGLFARL